VPNLLVADTSVMPTQGSANPALTTMALASRLADRLVAKAPPLTVRRRPVPVGRDVAAAGP